MSDPYFFPYPASVPSSHNGTHEACAVLVGPCGCGSIHSLADWKGFVIKAFEIERENEGNNGYIAFFKSKKIDVWAPTLLAARDKAAGILKARKAYDVHIAINIRWNVETHRHEQVVHSTSGL